MCKNFNRGKYPVWVRGKKFNRGKHPVGVRRKYPVPRFTLENMYNGGGSKFKNPSDTYQIMLPFMCKNYSPLGRAYDFSFECVDFGNKNFISVVKSKKQRCVLFSETHNDFREVR
eukprot:UN24308